MLDCAVGVALHCIITTGEDSASLALLEECVPLMVEKLGKASPITSYFQHVRTEILAAIVAAGQT